ncbi:MAG: serine/threonine protein kinase, bacterial, partial [Gaiellales bacterium]|nr:serine/threonine protein kinase, bacterial [Gaiellales bacterium]
DARVDVYSLGCVLFEALTGQVPYPKDSDVAKMFAHMNEPPAAVSALVPAAGWAFDPVVARALAKAPEERYPSAGDLGRAAVAAATGQAATVPERSVAAGSAALVTQPRAAAPTAQQTGPTAQLPVTAPPPAYAQAPPTYAQPPPAHASPRSSSKWPIVAVCATVLLVGGVALALAAAGVFKSKPAATKETTVVVQQPAAAPSAEPTTPAETVTVPAAPPSATAIYRAPTYAADYPGGWTIVSDYADKGAYTETKMQSRDGGAAVLIDRTPGDPQDPQLEAEGVESQTARTPGYKRVSWGPTSLGGKAGWKWVFDLPSGRRVDYFTNVGGGRFAVLGSGSDFTTAQQAAREVAASLR